MPGMGGVGAGTVFISDGKGKHLMMCLPLELRPEVSEGTRHVCVGKKHSGQREQQV